MASTTFINNSTLTDADWFNDLNTLHYTILGDPTTKDEVATALNFNLAPINLGLSASVASNALTIALKAKDGTDPSSTKPVLIPFRSATASFGANVQMVSVTAATSVTIPSGEDLGDSTVASDTKWYPKIWIVAFLDTNTVKLGVIRCGAKTSTGFSIRSLSAWGIGSSVTTPSTPTLGQFWTDSSTTAVTNKAFTVLGFVTYETGLATAATYASAPDRVEVYRLGDYLPGMVVQKDAVQDSTSSTGTTVLPWDNTQPLSTEGDSYLTSSLGSSQISKTHLVNVIVDAHATNSVAGVLSMALYRGTGDAIAAMASSVNTAARTQPLHLNFTELAAEPAIAANYVYNIRIGNSAAGTTTFNGTAGAGLFNGKLYSSITVQEICT